MYPNLEELILIDDTSMWFGMLVDLNCSFVAIPLREDDYLTRFVEWSCTGKIITVSDFEEKVTKSFEEEIDSDPEGEWDSDDESDSDDERVRHRKNPWLEDGKEPPTISIMKALPPNYLDSSVWAWGQGQ